MSEQDATQASTLQRPPNDDKEAWKAYWKTQGQQWRTEPEIDAERQKHLAERRRIAPDIIQGIYPFKDIKLSRADIEWVLATHGSSGMRGPVDWNDGSQREREGPDLRGANLRQANLSGLPLARMMGGLPYEVWLHATQEQIEKAAVHLQQADLTGAQLQGAFLREAQLQGANLWLVQLQEAYLYRVELQEAFLAAAQLQKAYLGEAQLQGANLRRADLEHAYLEGVTFSDQAYGSARLADINWGEVNLAVLDWEPVTRLGDEQVARQEKDSRGKTKDIQTRLDEHKEAVRANRQLAVVLRDQGLNEEAARFAYRAQLLQRKVLWYQRKFRQYLFSLFLDMLTGYGYKPIRSFITYAVVISVFAFIYFLLGPHIAWNEAIVISMTAFHGRGFFPEQFHPGDPQALAAAIEAFVGLLIEVTFIATLTQRLFGK